jgi:hypothetical protein
MLPLPSFPHPLLHQRRKAFDKKILHHTKLKCGGGLQYLHRSPASRRRRRKGNPVPGGITGPPCSRGI